MRTLRRPLFKFASIIAASKAAGIWLSLTLLATPGLAQQQGRSTQTVGTTGVLKSIAVCRASANGLGAAETLCFDPPSKRLFVSNASGSVDLFDLTNPARPERIGVIQVGRNVNSVAVPNIVAVPKHVADGQDRLLAVACEGERGTDPGSVRFYDRTGTSRGEVKVGPMPDQLTYTPDGKKILTANEGEAGPGPSGAMVDPPGSVSIIDVATREVKTLGLEALDRVRPPGVRVFPGKTPSRDIEPEYIAVTADSQRAVVCFQEANAWGVIDLAAERWLQFGSFGLKSWRSSMIDTSDKDGGIVRKPSPEVVGMPMPDTIAFRRIGGVDYLFTANEGDARDELQRAKKLRTSLEPTRLADAWHGRLKVSAFDGDTDRDGRIDVLHSYGARSFSIWKFSDPAARSGLVQVFDSGDDFERITAERLPRFFNADTDGAESDQRSDDKGPEPEAIAVGEIAGKTIAFIGLERTGGIMVYDVSTPAKPRFIDYINDRNHLAPETIKFIPGAASPDGKPLLVVAHEVSGTTVVYRVDPSGLGR